MAYKYQEARDAGLTDTQIVEYLAQKHNYRLTEAMEAGVTEGQALQHLLAKEGVELPTTVDPAAPEPANPSKFEQVLESAKNVGTAVWEGAKAQAIEYGDLLKSAALGAPEGEGALPGPRGAKAVFGPFNAVDGIMHWIGNHNLDENVEQLGAKEGMEKTLRDNGLTAATFLLDTLTIAKGVPITTALRGTAMKMGARPAMALWGATTVEGAGYMAAYQALEGVFEGQAVGELAKDIGKGALHGGAFGAVLGPGAIGTEALFNKLGFLAKNRVQMEATWERAAKQEASVEKALVDEAVRIAETAPHLGDEQVAYAAQRVVVDGLPPEKALLEVTSPPRTVVQAKENNVGNLKAGEQADLFETRGVGAGTQKPKVEGKQTDLFGDRPDLKLAREEGTEEVEEAFGHALRYAGTSDDLRDAVRIADKAPDIKRVKIKQRGADEPFHGSPSMREQARAVGEEVTTSETVRDAVESTRRIFSAILKADPRSTHETRMLFKSLRIAMAQAKPKALSVVEKRVFNKLQGDAKTRRYKKNLLSDYTYFLDRAAFLKAETQRLGREAVGVGGATSKRMEYEAAKIGDELAKHPDVLQAYQEMRRVFDEMWFTMRREGMLQPNQYRQDYAPAQRLFDMARSLERDMRGTKVGKALSAQLKRTETGEYIQTDLVDLMTTSLEALNKKVAERRAWQVINDSPNLNLTRHFEVGEPISSKYAQVFPGKGVVPVNPDAMAVGKAGVASAMEKTVLQEGGVIIPKEIAERWDVIFNRNVNKYEQGAFAIANGISRWLTVYNPGNLVLNAMSDTPLAMMGMPGEKSDLKGFIRFYLPAVKQSWVGAFEGTAPFGMQKILGKLPERVRKPVGARPDFERAVEEGIVGSTFLSSIGGETYPRSLAELKDPRNWIQRTAHAVPDAAKRARQAVETAPRLAGALAAEQRALRQGLGQQAAQAEFGRIGREITLPFGTDEPFAAKLPIARILAPFWKWNGMAIDRMIQLTTTPGSRGRSIAGIAGTYAAMSMWNRQSEEFARVERSLPMWVQHSPHIILRNPDGTPMKEESGLPMFLQARWFVPGEVASLFGLGDFGSQVVDMVRGRLKPTEYLGQIGGEVAETAKTQPAPLHIIMDVLDPEDKFTGHKKTPLERFTGVVPLIYQLAAAGREASGKSGNTMENFMKVYVRRLVGVRQGGLGFGTQDAQMMGLFWDYKDHISRMHSAFGKKDQIGFNDHYKHALKKSERAIELMHTIKEERGEEDVVYQWAQNKTAEMEQLLQETLLEAGVAP